MHRLASFHRRESGSDGRLSFEFQLISVVAFQPACFRKPFSFDLTLECLILTVHVGNILFADNFEEPNENPPEPLAGSHMTSFSFGSHSNHEFDDGSRREELPDLPWKVFPKNRSNAIPLTSSLVSEIL